ncbi:Endonuclease YncB, thermonuclease family [Izhakiella capsodis]|uniref:Endonuclease YncB, thermonuclease family n=1 Tax=Izhakiella capsodis TaxID=1367852 RepID=A0A1I4WU24_9GAMM|nr:thermonuclease family protein [Izhakiella capsodis]SFN17318.1 Endonuclease YncB, thermonuclease family [Izhakiella capsodis]
MTVIKKRYILHCTTRRVRLQKAVSELAAFCRQPGSIFPALCRRAADLCALHHRPVKGWSLLALNLLLIVMPVQADIRGNVVWVFDGDTVAISDGRQQRRVRLIGIDAPERNQPYGERSRQALNVLISGKVVTARGDTQDNYGRLLAVIWLSGRDMNARQVADGMAWAYRFHRQAGVAAYARLEKQARQNRRGLWAGKSIIEPWRWRAGIVNHAKRTTQAYQSSHPRQSVRYGEFIQN